MKRNEVDFKMFGYVVYRVVRFSEDFYGETYQFNGGMKTYFYSSIGRFTKVASQALRAYNRTCSTNGEHSSNVQNMFAFMVG